MLIRLMADADREAAIDLLWQLNLHEKRLSHAALDVRSDRREDAAACLAFNDERIKDGGAHLVAEGDGRVVAYMCLVIQMAPPFIRAEFRRHLYVADLVVDEGARGRGVGRAMLGEADAFARRHGLRHILIGLVAHNDGADRLYASEGYAFYGVERLKTLEN